MCGLSAHPQHDFPLFLKDSRLSVLNLLQESTVKYKKTYCIIKIILLRCIFSEIKHF